MASSLPTIYYLDVGLGSNVQDISKVGESGRILRRDSDGQTKTLLSGLLCPDGIDISHSAGRIYWTNMGFRTSLNDGSISSANLDGSDIREVISKGVIHTPKQIQVDEENKLLYFCDREGLGVHRCNLDGTNHEVLILRGDWRTQDKDDMTRWCVGIAIDSKNRKFYWSQKGPPKSNQGRIFRANLDMTPGQHASNRSDIELVLQNLPEPIDLEIDTETDTLYWTDRGEHPHGSSLNTCNIRSDAKPKAQIIARHFSEPIGLKLDTKNGHVYVTDHGGSLYRCSLDGSQVTVLQKDGGTYAGITLF
ncbi:Low-density lipoprotein receptor-related protein 5 [Penicillium rolfsii]|nr:Low-density lipoprotein receptor-related protein 5 [Penicillium rolfsii]